MIIGIDARFAVHNRRGIGNYALRLIWHLAEIDSRNEYILYIDKDDFDCILPKQSNFKIKKLFTSNYLIWEQFALPLQAKKDDIDILHCTGNTSPIYLPVKIKLVSTIHDVAYLKSYTLLPKSPSLYQRLGRIYRKLIVIQAVKRVNAVITVSFFAKKDILTHLSHLEKKELFVSYLSASEVFKQIDKKEAKILVHAKFGIADDYILTIGGIDPQKNTALVIRNFIELREENKIQGKLIVVGIPNWKRTMFYSLVNNSKFKSDIMFIDFATEEELLSLYNGATVFIFPSLYESFGLPPLESMACGTPVITSNTGAIPEIVEDAALLINPHRGEELKVALLQLLDNKNLQDELIKRGLEHIKKFSWQKMAKDTLHIYELVCKEI